MNGEVINQTKRYLRQVPSGQPAIVATVPAWERCMEVGVFARVVCVWWWNA